MNKTFAAFGRSLKKDRYIESVAATFLLLPSYRRFPTDDEFERDIKVRDLYNFRSRSYWLRRLENYDRKERVPVDEFTIEHVLPQNDTLSDQWRADLGPDYERIQNTWLHTLGNLTLTGYNSELSDHPFLEKRDMKGGFADSPLRLNSILANLDMWNEEAIQHRADHLAERAVEVWKSPSLEESILGEYRPATAVTGAYSISDHPHLSGAVLPLFEAFRKEVLALDPAVTEEFSSSMWLTRQRLISSMWCLRQSGSGCPSISKFPELYDPKGLAKDVTALGRWGNGDVEIPFDSSRRASICHGLGSPILREADGRWGRRNSGNIECLGRRCLGCVHRERVDH